MKKKILLTNDDGLSSPGLKAAMKALEGLGELTVIVPSAQRSGAGRGLTPHVPLKLKKKKENIYTLNGTPTDAVIIAREVLFDKLDLLVSGINVGANIGIDAIMWSGTCGAAFEAASFGIPSIAASMEVKDPKESVHHKEKTEADFNHCTSLIRGLSERILNQGLPKGIEMLNLNFPCASPKGLAVARIGRRYLKGTVKKLSPDMFSIGGEILPDEVPGTDVYALHHQRKIVVSPISLQGFDADKKLIEKFVEHLM